MIPMVHSFFSLRLSHLLKSALILVAGLARREKEAVDCGPEDLDPTVVRQYVLRGMVVHSGQASGGHYYSYIRSELGRHIY